MIVYRVERRDDPKTGAFQASFHEPSLRHEIVDRFDYEFDPSSSPGPWRDGIPDHSANHFCGARQDQYAYWWKTPEIRRYVFNHPLYRVRAYDVPDAKVLQGHHQVMFRMQDATNVRNAKWDEVNDSGPKAPASWSPDGFMYHPLIATGSGTHSTTTPPNATRTRYRAKTASSIAGASTTSSTI